jgi:hypothetical protein
MTDDAVVSSGVFAQTSVFSAEEDDRSEVTLQFVALALNPNDADVRSGFPRTFSVYWGRRGVRH